MSASSARVVPRQKPHRSKQDYGTPASFIEAVELRFGSIAVDLAASEQNAKAPLWVSEAEDSLTEKWHRFNGLMWLNPPFGNIAEWADKCRVEAELGARILLLTPASVGSNWFAEHVHRHAFVLGLSPRLTFDGETTPYPKDLILSCFGFGVGFDTWRWKP